MKGTGHDVDLKNAVGNDTLLGADQPRRCQSGATNIKHQCGTEVPIIPGIKGHHELLEPPSGHGTTMGMRHAARSWGIPTGCLPNPYRPIP